MADQRSQGPTIEPPTLDTREPVTAPLHRGSRYELRELIAKGGMGEVYSAVDQQIDRVVAIKRMKETLPTAHAMARFLREAAIQGRLDHPAIVPVHELGVDEDGRPFFVMKKLAGTTLADRIAGLHPREALLRAFVDVCLAVEFAHSRGIVHRDLKPANIVLGDYGEVYVLDWGVAKIVGRNDDSALTGEGQQDETGAGAIVGTVAYMAPEQAGAAAEVDARADVYALGCILFEILAGESLHKRLRDDTTVDARPSARGKNAPPELEALTVAATARYRDQRLATARELGERVQRFLDGDRDLVQRRELARTHLELARAAFEKTDEASRRSAMRDAGRALALDPQLPAAAELVTRLMLEPPQTTPDEVKRAIMLDDTATLHRSARIGSWAYLGFLGLVPVLVGDLPLLITTGLTLTIAVNVALLRLWRPFGPRRLLAVGFSNAALVCLLAYMFSPFFIAPGVAGLITMLLMFSPTYDDRPSLITLMSAMAVAVLAPFAAEQLGLLSQTMFVGPSSVTFGAPVPWHVDERIAQLSLVLYVLALIGAAAWMGQALRGAERRMRKHLHLQAWQLRQLVPDGA